jgi:biotin carboxyl carrier protein
MESTKVELVRWDKEKNIVYFRQNGILYKAKVLEFNKEKKMLNLYVFNLNKTVILKHPHLKREKSNKNLEPKEQKSSQILSPISGCVTKIFAKANELVKKGKPLLIIESMKMENEICAPFDLFVKNVSISKGDLVKQNQLLVEIEPPRKVVP